MKTRYQESVLRYHFGPLLVACLDRAIVDNSETVSQDCDQQVQHDDHCDGCAHDQEDIESDLYHRASCCVAHFPRSDTDQETEDRCEGVIWNELVLLRQILADSEKGFAKPNVNDK